MLSIQSKTKIITFIVDKAKILLSSKGLNKKSDTLKDQISDSEVVKHTEQGEPRLPSTTFRDDMVKTVQVTTGCNKV